MKKVEITTTMFEAGDGRRFEREIDCQAYEVARNLYDAQFYIVKIDDLVEVACTYDKLNQKFNSVKINENGVSARDFSLAEVLYIGAFKLYLLVKGEQIC